MQQRAAVKALERLIDAFPHMHLRGTQKKPQTEREGKEKEKQVQRE